MTAGRRDSKCWKLAHGGRGFTRKEPFARGIWTPQAENWNGRVAQIGFAGILLTEAIVGQPFVQFWGSKLFGL
jgi:hypothetical protein